jgi:hypothetical protein
MKKLYALLFLCSVLSTNSFANNYATPGTGIRWTLTQLVANAGGDVTFVAGEYFVNDTVYISLNDTLNIESNAVVKFVVGSYLDVNGVLIVNPPTNVTFTAVDQATGFLGMRIDSSNGTSLRKLTFEYAVSLRLTDCNIKMDSCIIQYNNNNASTSFGNGALALFRSSPTITNCKFIENKRAAIQGGANINNAPKIYNSLFQRNNTSNQNVPQINLGATSNGNDTVKIINNQILGGGGIMSGGIGFLPTGSVYAIISGNLIRNNRYGLTFSGGSAINAVISYNVVDSNNIQNDPNLGGSGISFTGGSASSHQNSIVTGNIFRANLWGITIQNFAKPNLGDLTNADTTDDGKNQFINNTNSGTNPNIDLYNNSPDPIMAQGNWWGAGDAATVEARIFHQTDNAALGLVNYASFITSLPISIKQFALAIDRDDVKLNWQTSNENNSSYFNIEKSINGHDFNAVGSINAKGTASSYQYSDNNAFTGQSILYYRLKMVDKDGKFAYSPILTAKKNEKAGAIRVYPTIATSSQIFNAEISSDRQQNFTVQFITVSGQTISKLAGTVQRGKNLIALKPTTALPTGQLYVLFIGENFVQTVPVQIK